MPAKNEELIATFLDEKFRFDNADGDVIIGVVWANSDLNQEITIKGQADLDELQKDQDYRFYGRWANYKNKRTGKDERQFHFNSFVRQQPASRAGVIAYLRQAGDGRGFGGVRANKLWELFGSDAVRMMREEPDQVVEALAKAKLPLAIESARLISESLQAEVATEGSLLDLTDLFSGRGFPKGAPKAAIKIWGAATSQVIRRNPYLLMMRVRGCGFKRCDALYLDLGLPPGKLKRQALCAWHAIARDTEGHTWYPIEFVSRGLRESIRGADLREADAFELATRAKYLSAILTDGGAGPIRTDGDRPWFAEHVKAKSEKDLATIVAEAMAESVAWPNVEQIERISDHQREQLGRATNRGPVAILGGGPGTGKTFTAAALIRSLAATYGLDNIAIGAPTGKAAVRITEAMQAAGLNVRARTWHSLLALLESQGMSHFPFKVLVGDEQSMQDTDMCAAVFRRRAKGTLVLLVGDVNQLPPVGHGAPLRDLIAAGVPYGELREIKRNSGGIVETCAAIRDGQRWQPGDNLIHISANDPAAQIRAMLAEIKKNAADVRSAIWDYQILVPVNKKSELARNALNRILQDELNPNPSIAGSPFRLGDKIVNTKNGYFPCAEETRDDEEEPAKNERGELYVANGELGEVIEAAENYCVAKLSAPARAIKIPRGKATEIDDDQGSPDGDGENSDKTGTGCSWDLGYALSVHKSQGSEWPTVVVMIDQHPGARMVCSREWLYTAISRAKSRCVLIGQRSVADQMVKRQAIGKRKTFLRELILQHQAQLTISEI